jgi:hypothetical protein
MTKKQNKKTQNKHQQTLHTTPPTPTTANQPTEQTQHE